MQTHSIGQAEGSTISLVLKRRRQKANMTIHELAIRSGLSSSYISRLERNQRSNVSISALKKLAGALDVPVSYLGGFRETHDQDYTSDLSEIILGSDFMVDEYLPTRKEKETILEIVYLLYGCRAGRVDEPTFYGSLIRLSQRFMGKAG